MFSTDMVFGLSYEFLSIISHRIISRTCRFRRLLTKVYFLNEALLLNKSNVIVLPHLVNGLNHCYLIVWIKVSLLAVIITVTFFVNLVFWFKSLLIKCVVQVHANIFYFIW